MKTYAVYGLRVASDWDLRGYTPASGPADVVLRRGAERTFAAVRDRAPGAGAEWPHYAALDDGRIYLRWREHFEFLVSADGALVEGLSHADACEEGFQTYLLGQVLSFVLIQRGLEPLHATAVRVACGAVAFLADSGVGKSTLAGTFVREGHAVVTDDLLVALPVPAGFLAQPGPPRIKLFPEAAAVHAAPGQATLNPLSDKLVIALDQAAFAAEPVPLRALYVLAPRPHARSARVLIRRMRGPRAFRALMHATYNNYVESGERMVTQFRLLSALAAQVPVSLLSYPRTFQALDAVRRRVIADACD